MNNNMKQFGKLAIVALLVAGTGCTRDIDTSTPATYPGLSEVFIDGFASDLQFQAWGKSTNFDVDTQTKYEGTTAMAISVPEPGDPLGSWAGGTFYSTIGRDLSGFDALTFYAKSSATTQLEAGIGNWDEANYIASVSGIDLNEHWRKVVIPIPNPAKLTAEQGLFYYSAGATEEGEAYTIWIDNVRFERLNTLAHHRIADMEVPGFPGNLTLGNLNATINLPDGVDCHMSVSPNYYTFQSSDPEVATVDDNVINIHKGEGSAVITVKEAKGNINVHCYDYAPEPQLPATDVISIYSDTYPAAVSGITWNPHWNWSTAEYSEIETGNQHIGYYTQLNFVGILFNTTLDCSAKTHMHIDLLCMDEVSAATELKVEIHNAVDDGFNVAYPIRQETHADFKTKQWISVDIPLHADERQIPQLALVCSADITNVLFDNIYFY